MSPAGRSIPTAEQALPLDSSADEGRGGRRVHLLARRFGALPTTDVIGLIACLAPIVVACARGLAADWRPVYDSAYFTARSLDVLTDFHPFVGSWSTFGAMLNESIKNLGPLQLLALAPFTRLDPFVGSAVGVGIVNVLAVLAVWWCSRRLFGRRGVAAVMAATAVLQMSFGAPALIDARQQHALLLPFWALMWLTVVLVSGKDTAVVPWIVAGSFVLQTHFSYAYLVVVVVVFGVVGYWWSARGRRRTPRFVGHACAGLAVGVVLWSHTLWDQAFGTGNLGRVLAYSGGRNTAGWNAGVRILADSSLGYPFWWPGSVRDFDDPWTFRASVAWGIFIAWLVALAAVLLAAGRRNDRRTALLASFASIVMIAALVSAARIPRSSLGSLPQTYFWLWPVSLFAGLAVVAGLSQRLPRVDDVTRAATLVAIVAGGLTLPDRLTFPQWDINSELRKAGGRPMLEQIGTSLDGIEFDLGPAVVVDDELAFRLLLPDYYNIVAELTRHDVAVRFPNRSSDLNRFGYERCEAGDERWRMIIVVGRNRPTLTRWDVVLSQVDGPAASTTTALRDLDRRMLDLLAVGEIVVDFDRLPADDVAGARIRSILESPLDVGEDLWFNLFVLVENGYAIIPPNHRAAYRRWSDLTRANIASYVLVYLTPNFYPASEACRR